MKKINGAADLDTLYQQSEEADKGDFAKMRTGLQLIAGQHYNQKSAKAFERIRTSSQLEDSVKIRLTKNHIGRIARRYSNIIVTSAPGVSVGPKHKKELQDTKAADLNEAIWVDGKEKNDWKSTVMQWSDDFCGIGEVASKLYFDPYAGPIVGYEQAVHPETGEPQVDPQTGQPMPDQSKPQYEGQIKFEELFGFNLLADPLSMSIKTSSYYCVRKAVTVEALKAQFPDKASKINSTGEKPFMVFDISQGYRKATEEELLLKEWYIRPCPEYPKGYYYIAVTGTILDEDELPDGIFPIVVERFESVQTKRRGVSMVEPLRPYNAEINRAASKIAEHQITLGDDKVIMQAGSKMSAGGQVPGVRGVTVSGPGSTIIPGRSGSQYAEYAMSTIKEMYDYAEIDDDEIQANMEPHTLLYRSATQKRKFSRYITRFEQFMKQVCKTYLRMAKYYFTPEMFVCSVGRNEAVNISEFKNSIDQSLEIVVEEQSDDVESKLGRQLTFQHALQYIGPQLPPDAIGQILRMMPYSDADEAFSDLTVDDENATNDILALDRGQDPIMGQYDNHEYLIKRVTTRMRQSDFKLLSPQIQQNYEMYVESHNNVLTQQKDAMIRSNSGFIPDGGALIGADYFIEDSTNPGRTRRARFPYDAIDWLAKKLEEQGTFRRMAETLPHEVQAQQQGQGNMPMAQASQHQMASGGDQGVPQSQPGGGAEISPPSS